MKPSKLAIPKIKILVTCDNEFCFATPIMLQIFRQLKKRIFQGRIKIMRAFKMKQDLFAMQSFQIINNFLHEQRAYSRTTKVLNKSNIT
jgi:hypothetical protein